MTGAVTLGNLCVPSELCCSESAPLRGLPVIQATFPIVWSGCCLCLERPETKKAIRDMKPGARYITKTDVSYGRMKMTNGDNGIANSSSSLRALAEASVPALRRSRALSGSG